MTVSCLPCNNGKPEGQVVLCDLVEGCGRRDDPALGVNGKVLARGLG